MPPQRPEGSAGCGVRVRRRVHAAVRDRQTPSSLRTTSPRADLYTSPLTAAATAPHMKNTNSGEHIHKCQPFPPTNTHTAKTPAHHAGPARSIQHSPGNGGYSPSTPANPPVPPPSLPLRPSARRSAQSRQWRQPRGRRSRWRQTRGTVGRHCGPQSVKCRGVGARWRFGAVGQGGQGVHKAGAEAAAVAAARHAPPPPSLAAHLPTPLHTEPTHHALKGHDEEGEPHEQRKSEPEEADLPGFGERAIVGGWCLRVSGEAGLGQSAARWLGSCAARDRQAQRCQVQTSAAAELKCQGFLGTTIKHQPFTSWYSGSIIGPAWCQPGGDRQS